MRKVFIGGSRQITKLNAQVRQRLDQIIEKELEVLIGDANGADKAVQQYLHTRSYRRVLVFCSNGTCRNNIGRWETRAIPAPRGATGFEYYSAKDRQMAREASVGFMLWDGHSRGTLANIIRLLDDQKKVVVYLRASDGFATVKTKRELEQLLAHLGVRKHKAARDQSHPPVGRETNLRQERLF